MKTNRIQQHICDFIIEQRNMPMNTDLEFRMMAQITSMTKQMLKQVRTFFLQVQKSATRKQSRLRMSGCKASATLLTGTISFILISMASVSVTI